MIQITDGKNTHTVIPTIFPDGTSQVWKLPEWVFDEDASMKVVWFFENEREIIDLFSLNKLTRFEKLSIPYLPYARQDKATGNLETFNLSVICNFLNRLHCEEVESVDVHNPGAVEARLNYFTNRGVNGFHHKVFYETRPTYIIFPDAGAAKRYSYLQEHPHIVFEKERNQSTGEIIGHKPVKYEHIRSGDSFLIVDDICDGGATFCSISKLLHEVKQNIGVHLAVTHGLFSKGKEVLYNAGINEIFTTNSLLKNKDGFKVV